MFWLIDGLFLIKRRLYFSSERYFLFSLHRTKKIFKNGWIFETEQMMEDNTIFSRLYVLLLVIGEMLIVPHLLTERRITYSP